MMPHGGAFSPGTQVVIEHPVMHANGEILHPKGAVGVVERAVAEDRYMIRFIDGYETVLPATGFAIRSHKAGEKLREGGGGNMAGFKSSIIYRCVIGSRAYGLDHEASDTDRRGFYLPPADLHWSIYGVPQQLEDDAAQECYWELGKFITLALKANPMILECLYSPLVEYAAPAAEMILERRDIFLSRLVYQTYNGYVISQFRKMQRRNEATGEISWPHAMHLVRLLGVGIGTLRDGTPNMGVGDLRERLLAIKRGEVPWPEVDAWRLDLHRQFDAAFRSCTLPEHPDYEAANTLLIAARRSAL